MGQVQSRPMIGLGLVNKSTGPNLYFSFLFFFFFSSLFPDAFLLVSSSSPCLGFAFLFFSISSSFLIRDVDGGMVAETSQTSGGAREEAAESFAGG